MISSADLRAEVLERLESLGRGKAWSASHVANHGEKRSVSACWTALDDLWCEGVVEWVSEERFRLPVQWVPVDEQLGLEVEA